MKNIFFFLTSLILFFSCSSKNNLKSNVIKNKSYNIDAITLLSNYGDGVSELIIYKNLYSKSDIDSFFLSELMHNVEYSSLSIEAYEYLKKSISINCINNRVPIPNNDTLVYMLNSVNYFHLNSNAVNKKNKKELINSCYYYYPNEVSAYFEKLKQQLINSDFKKDYSLIIDQINFILEHASKGN